jgi:hypothetical protein
VCGFDRSGWQQSSFQEVIQMTGHHTSICGFRRNSSRQR